MSLDKVVKYGKEKRKPYRGSKLIDYTCRNHGGCPYCEQNRKHKFRDKHPVTKDEWVVWITDGRKDPSFLLLFLDLAAMAIGLYFRSLYQGQLERYDNGILRPQHVVLLIT